MAGKTIDHSTTIADALLELHRFGRFTDDTIESLTEISSYNAEEIEASKQVQAAKSTRTSN